LAKFIPNIIDEYEYKIVNTNYGVARDYANKYPNKKGDFTGFIDIKESIGKNRIKSGITSTMLHPVVAPKVVDLFKNYPNLYLVETSRPKSSGIGAKNSIHKWGTAIDIRTTEKSGKDIELLSQQFADPLKHKEIVDKYGITMIWNHRFEGGAWHIHMEFNPYK